MKKIVVAFVAAALLVSTASAQVLKKQGVQNTLWTGAGLPSGEPGDDDRAKFRWTGVIDTIQARLDYKVFTIDGMLAWGALTNWNGVDGNPDFVIKNTDMSSQTFLNLNNIPKNSYYLNFLAHPNEYFDAGIGTSLKWKVGPSPSVGGDPWDTPAHVRQGDLATAAPKENTGFKNGKPVAKTVAGFLRYANFYAMKAIAVRYHYKDIVEVGVAIPDGFTTDHPYNPAVNFGFQLHPIDLLTVAFAYEKAFVDGGNLYTGLTLAFTEDFNVSGYFAFDGIGYKDEDPARIWGSGATIFIRFPSINLSIAPEAGFTAYANNDYTWAFFTGIRLQYDFAKKFHLGAWTSLAWGAENKKWHDSDYAFYNTTKDWNGGFIINVRPDFTFDINAKHSISATTEFEHIDYPDRSAEDKFLIGLYWRYKTF